LCKSHLDCLVAIQTPEVESVGTPNRVRVDIASYWLELVGHWRRHATAAPLGVRIK